MIKMDNYIFSSSVVPFLFFPLFGEGGVRFNASTNIQILEIVENEKVHWK